MNYSIQKFEMPNLILTRDELQEIIYRLMAKIEYSFDFNSFKQGLANHLLANNIGFEIEPNTSYSGSMKQKDEGIVREIIWDLIILRYLTPGGNGHDTWPTLTITSRGKDFFGTLK
ncbi:hypothetical protein D9M68_645320 [compost metagenome]